MAEINFCPQCGTPVPEETRFCPRCGRSVTAAEAAHQPAGSEPRALASEPLAADAPSRVRLDARDEQRSATEPPPRPSAKTWLIGVPVTIVVVVLLGWAVLNGLPFGNHDQQLTRSSGPATVPIEEGSARTTTVSQIDEPAPVPQTRQTSVTDMGTAGTVNASAGSNAAQAANDPRAHPRRGEEGASARASTDGDGVRPGKNRRIEPSPVADDSSSRTMTIGTDRDDHSSVPPGANGQLSESGAIGRLRAYFAASNPYGIPSSCFDVRSLGFSNRGYTLQILQTQCDEAPDPPHILGRWRVDTLTREVFRQRSDGRYLRP